MNLGGAWTGPGHNPGIWAKGISERQYQRIFGTATGEPILDRPVQQP